MKVSFKIYDLNGDGFISKEELFNMLKSCIHQTLVSLKDEDIRLLVEQTFSEVDTNQVWGKKLLHY